MRPLVLRKLGRVRYADGLQLQARLVAQRKQGQIPDQLLLLEHEPVFTLGSSACPENVLLPRDALRERGFDVCETGRGGKSIWGGPFEDEVRPEVKFDRPGLLAMANSGPNTNRSQFFITTVPTPWLNMHHTIFGEVVDGMDVVKKIERVATGPGNRPLKEQKIIKAYIK